MRKGGRVPLITILDSSLATHDEVKEREGRMVIINEMGSDTIVDRGIGWCKNGLRPKRAHVNMP